jgi:hypothetical protein
MPFTNPSWYPLARGERFTATMYNELITKIKAGLSDIDGDQVSGYGDLNVPVTLDRGLQGINGSNNRMWKFKSIMGTEGDTVAGGAAEKVVRDVSGYGFSANNTGAAGGTTNRNAMQAAIDDLPTTGGVILVPPGIFDFNGQVTLRGSSGTHKDNVTITGFGPCTQLKQMGVHSGTGSGPFFVMGGTNAKKVKGHVVCDMILDGYSDFSDPLHQTDCIHMGSHSFRPVVHNLTMKNTYNGGPALTVSATDLTSPVISHCRFSNITGHCISMTSSTSVDTIGRPLITGNIFETPGASSYYIWFDGTMYGAIISGNIFKASPQPAIVIQANPATNDRMEGIQITGNLFDSNKHGIQLWKTDQTGDASIGYLRNCVICGNVVANATDNGIDLLQQYIYASAPDTSNRAHSICGNVVIDSDSSGIAADGDVGGGFAADIRAGSISGNCSYGNGGQGISMRSEMGNAYDNGNRLDKNTMFGNCCYDNDGYGIKLFFHTGVTETDAIENNVITGNIVDQNDTGSIYADGDNDINHNVGHTETAST